MENISSEMEGSSFVKISNLKITYQGKSLDFVKTVVTRSYRGCSSGDFIFFHVDNHSQKKEEILRLRYNYYFGLVIAKERLTPELIFILKPFFKEYGIRLF